MRETIRRDREGVDQGWGVGGQPARMARASTDQATGLLGYTKTRMTNGRMEGINRKMKPLGQQAYGFRDDGFLRLQLYALHERQIQT